MPQPWVVVDFESASYANLKRTGAYRYWADPTTEALCLGWKTMSGRRGCWWPGDPCPFPDKVFDDYMFVAHNAAFERCGWEYMQREFGWRPVPLQQWHDTMAVALYRALPASLDKLLIALRMPFEKDKDGTKAVLTLSKPDKHGHYPERTPELKARIEHYCLDGDVEQQWALHRRLGWLPPAERKIWELSQEVNDRGIRIDMDFVRAAQKIVDEASRPLMAEFEALTGVRVNQLNKIIGWCKDEGVDLPDMKKETLAALLGDDEPDEDVDPGEVEDEVENGVVHLPAPVERALKIRQLIGSASIKKLKAMRECVGYDGRARGLMIYHGTTPGRQTAKLLQPHNFPRPTVKEDGDFVDPQALVAAVKTGDWQWVEALYGPAVEVVVSGLRHAICAEQGSEYFSGDYSGIQLRTVLAMAGQTDKTALVSAKDRGESDYNAYLDMAGRIYKRPITKKDLAEYTIGKNAVLGLGFQGGPKMFKTKMAPKESLEFCQTVVDTYRQEWAPCVPELWKGLQWAAIDTVWDGTPHESHGIVYFLRDTALVARFPDASEISYQYPEKTRRLAPWSTEDKPVHLRGFSYKVVKQGRWISRDAFGGQLTENAVMHIERQIMEGAKQRLRANGYLQVLEVHDENITEQTIGRSLDEFRQIMEAVEPWVVQMGIPIQVDCWQGPVYRK